MIKIFILFFYCTIGLAQSGSIQGTIYNRIEKMPSTAVINIIGTELYTQADLKGNFKFEKVKTGNYSLKIMDIVIGGNEIFTDIEVTENTITYLNLIIPKLCNYEDKSINHKKCPVCLDEKNVVPIEICKPHLNFYSKKKDRRKQKKIKYEFEKYDEVKKVYVNCKFEHPYCSPEWYCVTDKVKF